MDYKLIVLLLLAAVSLVIAETYTIHMIQDFKASDIDRYKICREAGGIPVSGNAWMWSNNNTQIPVCLNPSAIIELKE